MARRSTVALLAVALVAVAAAIAGSLLGGLGDRGSVAPRAVVPPAPTPPTVVAPTVAPPPASDGVGFRSEARLREHHDKHGREFGRVTAVEYLALAQELRDRPLGPRVLEATRPDGVVTRYDRDTGAFLAFERDGTIRTFFKPRDGEAYFRRQRDRRPERER